MNIDINVARKVLQTVDAGLCRGMGNPIPGEMCVEAAVCYAMGLPHSDEPACVAPALRRLKIRLNDSNWSSDVARSKGLRRLALAQLGSAGHLDEVEFAKRCARLAIQTSLPEALRAVAALQRDEGKKARMLKAADRCEKEGTRESAVEAKSAYAAADAAAAAAYAAYAADAADAAAAYAADAAAAYAADAADAAAYAAAYAADAADAAAAYAAYAYAARSATRDRMLAAFAEGVVQILVEMKAPGVDWLGLTEDGEGGLAA